MEKDNKILLGFGLVLLTLFLLSYKKKGQKLDNNLSNNTNPQPISIGTNSTLISNPTKFNQIISSIPTNNQSSTQIVSGTSNDRLLTIEQDCQYLWLVSAKPKDIQPPEVWAQRKQNFIKNCLAQKRL